MKPLTKAVISLCIASSMFFSGCRTYTNPSRISNVPASRIQFVEEDPQTLDDLIRATEDIGNSIDYAERFDKIKGNIRADNQEKTKKDIRSLVYDIERSNLGNKYGLANQIKGFGYYRFDEVKVVAPDINSAEFWNEYPGLSAIALGGMLLIGKGIGDAEKEGKGGEALLGTGLFAGSILLIRYLLKGETYYNKVYYNPYNDQLRTIDTHLENQDN